MPRAAGDSATYTWKLSGRDDTIDFPSVTHILHSVKDVLGFGGMSWWGYKIGIRALNPKANDDEIEELYEAAKATDWTPNKVRDTAGERGTGAHDLMEAAANGLVTIEQDGDDVIVVADDPAVLADIVFGPTDRSAAKKKWVKDGILEYEPEDYRLSAARWWLRQEHDLVFAERTVWSVRYGFQGTLDMARDVPEYGAPGGGIEIVDYKTHKPSTGMRKDGTYREGEGPAYADDMFQLDGYAIAVEEQMLGVVVAKRVVLFGPDGETYEDRRTVPAGSFLILKQLHDVVCRSAPCVLLAHAYKGGLG